MIGINGADAHLVQRGDLVIIITYAQPTDHETRSFVPRMVHVDADNRIIDIGSDPAEALTADVERPPHRLDTTALPSIEGGLRRSLLPLQHRLLQPLRLVAQSKAHFLAQPVARAYGHKTKVA